MMDSELRDLLVRIERAINWVAFAVGVAGFSIVMMLWELKK